MRDRLEPLIQWVRDHRFWITLPAAVLIPVLAAVWVGRESLERAEAWRTRGAALEATRTVATQWRATLVSPPPAESAAWLESSRAVRQRGIAEPDRIAIMQRVAERAEGLGLSGVSVAFMETASLVTGPPRELGGEVFELAPYGLEVRFGGDYAGVASFIGSLPPQVEVLGLRLATMDEGVDALVTLLVYLGGDEVDGGAP